MTFGTHADSLRAAGAATCRGISARGLVFATRGFVYLVVTLAALVWTFIWLRYAVRHGTLGFDFEGTLWDAGVAILDGRSPYPRPVAAEVDVGNPAVYPPLLMTLVAPFTILPWGVGLALWTGVLIGSIVGGLYLLEVRDPRCYALALISAPVLSGFILGNATVLLVPLVALVWRWRDRWYRAGVVLGLAIAVKLVLLPLLLWLLGTRRYRAFVAAVGAACAGVIVPWAVIGFDGFTAYPNLLRVAARTFGPHGYSLATMLRALGLDTELAIRASLLAGLVLGVFAFVAGRRGRDTAAVSLAVLAAILGAPIVAQYYYALLLVPLAIVRPRFSGLWMILPLFYFANRLPIWLLSDSPPRLWPALANAGVALSVVLIAFASSDRMPRST